MALTKERKKEIVEELKELLKKQKAMVVVNFHGLNSQEVFDLKQLLKENKAEFRVIKKTLAELAFKDQGIDFKKDSFQGQLAIVFGFEDETSPVKTIYQYSKKLDKLEILGGYLENEFLDSQKIIEIAQLPSREELLAKLISVLNSSISGFVNVLQGNIKGLVYTLQAIANQ
jgi:large subunit ribosomal protein L10